MSNTYRAEQLLRRLGVIPDDLSLAKADPAEARGKAEAEAKK